jgi:hypothetical protein
LIVGNQNGSGDGLKWPMQHLHIRYLHTIAVSMAWEERTTLITEVMSSWSL